MSFGRFGGRGEWKDERVKEAAKEEAREAQGEEGILRLL